MSQHRTHTTALQTILPEQTAIQVLIADDHELVLDALRPALQGLAETVHILECRSFAEALDLAANDGPLSLAVLSLTLPGMNGAEGIPAFRRRFPETPLAILSGSHSVDDILDAFDHGAIGFLSKSHNAASIANAIGLMLSGQRYIPGEVMDALQRTSAARTRPAPSAKPAGPLQRLTSRESDVLGLLIKGQPNKSIARLLGVQEVTVKLHIRKLLRKLRAANRTQAVTFALQAGWTPDN